MVLALRCGVPVTWYAQQLIADAIPSLIDELRAHPTFAPGLFHVRDLAESRKVHVETVEVVITVTGSQPVQAQFERGPRLPPDGLVFVRELCELDDEDHMLEWFGDDAISWVVAPRLDLPSLALSRSVVAERVLGVESLPPETLLREAKRLSIAHRASITWYSTFFWGGTQEIALAWVFDPVSAAEVAYAFREEVDRRPGSDDERVWRIDERGERRITQGDVLSLSLLHHGLAIHHDFVPHRRSFDWDAHRIS
jgi:hypothetical protein